MCGHVPALILAALFALSPSPAAAISAEQCKDFEAAMLPLLEAQNSIVVTTDGCANADNAQVCDIVGVRGPCSSVSGCGLDTIADGCNAANADTSCCVVTYVRDCGVSTSSFCTATTPLGVCGQFCDASEDDGGGGGGGSNAGVAAGVSVGVILLVALAVGVGIFCYCLHKRSSGRVPQPGKVVVRPPASSCCFACICVTVPTVAVYVIYLLPVSTINNRTCGDSSFMCVTMPTCYVWQ